MNAATTRLALLAAGALLVGAPCLPGLCPAPAAAQEAEAAKGDEEKAAEPKGTVYHFGYYAQRTNVLFESETTVETIHGITHTISGTATLDFEAGKGGAKVSIPVDSLRTGLEARDEHMRGEDWLDAAKHPDIVFEATGIKRVKVLDEKAQKETWAWEGKLTLKGKTNEVRGEALVQRIPADLGKKLGPGSWVKVKTSFQVALKEFGVEVPEVAAAKVSPTWDITVDLFGTTAEPKGK